ncbi:uncharacterized protein K441DRAFT_365005 [Cenococcum geophilum 1.58]|uniref:uncharacterized protein n=1 Tax=Cenococcum geophilum 1.58 TaxID=794803 RepID=UPI00358F97C6|nr:hypothetical protein K441DRAFT_365005 [Cenococcum geophilum 1.58]
MGRCCLKIDQVSLCHLVRISKRRPYRITSIRMSRTSLPLMGSLGPSYQTYGNKSPSGITAPASATISAGTGSPRLPSGLQSPISTVPRSLTWGSRTPGRRLSVPSGDNPFQGPQGPSTFPQPYISPLPSSTSSIFSQNNSLFASPTSSIFTESRRDSNAAEADWRRRTWHPGTYTSLGPRPATSSLSYYETQDAPYLSFSSQPAANQTTRLPGIEGFDHATPPPSLPHPNRPDIARLVSERALNSDSGSEADDEEREERESEPATSDSMLQAGPNLASLDLVGTAQAALQEGVKTWVQLKEWTSRNPALAPNIDTGELLLPQAMHAQDLLLQQQNMNGQRIPPQSNNAGAAPNAQPGGQAPQARMVSQTVPLTQMQARSEPQVLQGMQHGSVKKRNAQFHISLETSPIDVLIQPSTNDNEIRQRQQRKHLRNEQVTHDSRQRKKYYQAQAEGSGFASEKPSVRLEAFGAHKISPVFQVVHHIHDLARYNKR